MRSKSLVVHYSGKEIQITFHLVNLEFTRKFYLIFIISHDEPHYRIDRLGSLCMGGHSSLDFEKISVNISEKRCVFVLLNISWFWNFLHFLLVWASATSVCKILYICCHIGTRDKKGPLVWVPLGIFIRRAFMEWVPLRILAVGLKYQLAAVPLKC